MSLITIKNETHTIGNLINSKLLEDDTVIFTAYIVEGSDCILQVESDEPEEKLKNTINLCIADVKKLKMK